MQTEKDVRDMLNHLIETKKYMQIVIKRDIDDDKLDTFGYVSMQRQIDDISTRITTYEWVLRDSQSLNTPGE